MPASPSDRESFRLVWLVEFDAVLMCPPRSRYLPAIGRFLIVVTFLEDALRIITQWSDQLLYLRDYRHSRMQLSPLGMHNRESRGRTDAY